MKLYLIGEYIRSVEVIDVETYCETKEKIVVYNMQRKKFGTWSQSPRCTFYKNKVFFTFESAKTALIRMREGKAESIRTQLRHAESEVQRAKDLPEPSDPPEREKSK